MQYAYKKDGKGERHGDAAERKLAAEAKKHIVQPISQPMPAHLMSGGPPSAPAAMLDNDAGRLAVPGLAVGTPFVNGRGGPPGTNYSSTPAPPSVPPPPHQQMSRPTPAPPSGLPARPPPSQAGYGGPQGFLPPGFNGAPPAGFPPPGAPIALPPGFQPGSMMRNR